MSKCIWIINDYAGSAYHGMEFRNYYFAKEFVKLGYKVYIISATYMHLFKKFPKSDQTFNFENIDGIDYIWVKVPKYKSSTDKKRVLKWFVFSFKLLFLPISKMQKPDFVIASPMAPFLTIPAFLIAKKFNAKFIFEVKDIWPLSIIELGGISPKNPLIKLMSWCEKFAVKKADLIVSSLQNYDEHLKKDLKIDKDFLWLNNGVSLEEMQNVEPLDKEIENKIPKVADSGCETNFPRKDRFIVGYTGTIGIANALEYLLEAAKDLQYNKDIVFIIVGDGKEKENLVKKYGYLDNIIFLDPIKKQQVQSMLKFFDVCYIGLRKEKLFKYGVSPNKLFDYMYSAKPVIYAIESGKNDLIKLTGAGISIESESSKSIKEAILEIYNLSEEERKSMGKSAKKYVIENFTYEKLAGKFLNRLERL